MIQNALLSERLDGWLFFDHHRRDILAYRTLGLSEKLHATRRWYYFVPAVGEPAKLVHRIEARALDSLPGQKFEYSSWVEQHTLLQQILVRSRAVAMQYSPECAIPYVSLVDGGTIELVRSFGVEVKTSANLVQYFEATWSEAQLQSHLEAGRRVDGIRADAFDLIRTKLRDGVAVTEWEVREFILTRFAKSSLVTDHGPIVAVNAHTADPHYEPSPQSAFLIGVNNVVLLDIWAKLNTPDSVYYDITWTAYTGETLPDKVGSVFGSVIAARDSGVEMVQQRIASGAPIHGYEVDDSVRQSIAQSGFKEAFVHRTGHSIGTEVHGAGANIDNFETKDERRLIPQTCFSIEPGIYLRDFGIRSEVDVYVDRAEAYVTGEKQTSMVLIA